MKIHRSLVWFGRLFLAGIFVWASVEKIADPQAFAKALFNYRMIPNAIIPVLAIGMPVMEIVAAVALFLKPLQMGASLIFLGLLIVFIYAISSAWARGLDVDCGCFGEGSSHVGPFLILRNVGLMVLAMWSYLKSPCR